MMSSGWFQKFTPSAPSLSLDLQIIFDRRVPILAILRLLPARRDMAGVGETCSKIADPYAYQGRIEDDSLRGAKRRWLNEIKTKLRAVPEKSNQEDHS